MHYVASTRMGRTRAELQRGQPSLSLSALFSAACCDDLLRKWPNVMLGLMVMLRPCGARW